MALSIRALDLDSQGGAILARAQNGKISSAELERGRRAFQRARRFNADTAPSLQEALLLANVGRGRESLALAEGVVADEPDNRDGWIFVYQVAQAVGDRATEARAARAVRALSPQNAPVILRRRGDGG
jgi:hypothetical protein